MKLFSGRSNLEFAQKVCHYLDMTMGKLSISEFSDGEISVSFDENIRNEDVFIIQSTNPPSKNLLELFLMLDAAKRASAKSVTAVIPYFGYARQDRKDKPRVPISAKLMLDLIEAVGVNRIITMDLHSPQVQGFVNVPFDHLYSSMAVLEGLKKLNLDASNGVVLSPDMGSARMSQSYAKKLNVGFALIDKRRPKPNQAEVTNVVGELEDKHVLIIDDMIDTAGTICNAADVAMERGAKKVIAVGTHPVLSEISIKRLKESKISQVIVCDTIKVPDSKKFNKLKIISVSHVFGESIRRIIHGDSLSSMFKN